MGEPAVDFERLRDDLEVLGAIGRTSDNGIDRRALGPAFMEAHRWFQKRLREAGLEVRVDEALNVIGRLPGTEEGAAVVTGSHLDSVPNGGLLDGALGVVAGLEALRRLRELDSPLPRPLEVVAFTDEEGRFGGMFGSQAMAGLLTPETIRDARDLDGVSLVDAMDEHGRDAHQALRAARSPATIDTFVELHIEQGPVLDDASLHVGVVDGIVGLFRWNVTLIGAANHAGTTPMGRRKDASVGAAQILLGLPRMLDEYGSETSVATVGRLELFPGAANVVPGRAELSLDVRDVDPRVLERLGTGMRRAMAAIARQHDLMFEFEVVSEIAPVACAPRVRDTIEQAAKTLGVEHRRLPSGAGHDAQRMANLAPIGMIFVPSKGGKSHSPAEWTSWASIEHGANCLLRTLWRLAGGG